MINLTDVQYLTESNTDLRTGNEFLYRIQQVTTFYFEVLKRYLMRMREDQFEGLDDIEALLITHINNKIRVDGSGNLFIKLPDHSKFYGDMENYKELIGNREQKEKFLDVIFNEFDKYLQGDWEETGRVFMYHSDGGYVVTDNTDNDKLDIVKYLSHNLKVNDSELQNGLRFIEDNKLAIDKFLLTLGYMYKCSIKDSRVSFKFPDAYTLIYTIDDDKKYITREINTKSKVATLIDFVSTRTEITYEQYKFYNINEQELFKKFGIETIITQTEVGYITGLLLLGYVFINQEDNKEFISKFINWMTETIGVKINPDICNTLEKCIYLHYYDDRYGKYFYFFQDFISELKDPQQKVNLKLVLNYGTNQ